MGERGAGSGGDEKPRRAKGDSVVPSKGDPRADDGNSESSGHETGRSLGSVPPPPLSEPKSLETIHPSVPPLPAAGPWRSYKEIVSQLASRLVDGQKPIRVLQALRWENSVEEQFLKARGRELPKVGPQHYAAVDLGFDPRSKEDEFEEIARDIDRDLGEDDAIGTIMMKTALEYRDVVRMLASRGTPTFYGYARKLYGSPKDKFPDDKLTVRDLGHVLYRILTNIDELQLGATHERTLSSVECAAELNERFSRYFADTVVRVESDDSILADAAAGSDYVKVRTGAKFSPRDIDILEVHEGWVHVATSLNGQAQTVSRWLAKGPPRTTAVQEGLAALLEIFTFRTYPRRARRLTDRVLAVDKAEDGASFIDVFEWFRTEGYDESECFNNTRRIFRGGVVEGGAPFTKDACYCKGIVLNYAFIRSAVQHNRVDLIPYLFVGKVAHEDVPVLAKRVVDGVVKPPRYLPPMFRDLNGIAIWMAYSTFFSQLGGEAIADYYARLFERTG
ncbi:MAG: flavohemoglobin expression-modulating QEGLA motif protein [Polyangiaceae bacterium]